jgi:hypothetical protein
MFARRYIYMSRPFWRLFLCQQWRRRRDSQTLASPPDSKLLGLNDAGVTLPTLIGKSELLNSYGACVSVEHR